MGPHTKIRRLGTRLLAGAMLALLPGGCGGAAAPPHMAGAVNVTERDFAIESPPQLKAGNVVFHVHNAGPDQHELILLRVGTQPLPFRADGFTVDEEAVVRAEPGSLEPGQAGAVRDLRVQLAPGNYVLFCNMAGHYLGGMHSNLLVTQ